MSVSRYMATRLWQPIGAESDATWLLDSESSGFEKLESGLNAAPVDYARFGLLFLHDGEWNGTRIVSKEWVRVATAADTGTDPAADTNTPGGSMSNARAASPGSGTSASTRMWLPTRTRSSSGTAATGTSTTTRGSGRSGRSPTS